MDTESSPLVNFSGTARLFPLPNLVFFPHVVQPLHIFEPRYRQMTDDALDSDRLITLVLPKAGWEKDYAGKPALYSIACLGHVVAAQKLDDGRFNLLLRGLARVRILEEFDHHKPYRRARVELLVEVPLAEGAIETQLRQQLIRLAPRCFEQSGPVVEEFRKILESDLPLGMLADIVIFALPLEVEFKQSLLEELDVEQRMRRLTTHLQEICRAKRAKSFPPEFSEN